MEFFPAMATSDFGKIAFPSARVSLTRVPYVFRHAFFRKLFQAVGTRMVPRRFATGVALWPLR